MLLLRYVNNVFITNLLILHIGTTNNSVMLLILYLTTDIKLFRLLVPKTALAVKHALTCSAAGDTAYMVSSIAHAHRKLLSETEFISEKNVQSCPNVLPIRTVTLILYRLVLYMFKKLKASVDKNTYMHVYINIICTDT